MRTMQDVYCFINMLHRENRILHPMVLSSSVNNSRMMSILSNTYIVLPRCTIIHGFWNCFDSYRWYPGFAYVSGDIVI
jgi:hypothetical protein